MAYLDKVKLADYTRKEDWLNSISHMVGGGLSVVALLMCCIKSIILRRWNYLLLSFIYGITMIAMYSCSSVYHALRPNNGKKVMRMIDHSMIYPMIAGTITPFALLVIKPVKPVLGWVIFAVAWVVVATMIPLTLTIFEKTKGIDVVMYLALGWLIIISIKTLWEVFSRTGVILLISGGIAYTLQMVGQKYAQPSVASIVMSLESVFAVLAGWIILGEVLKKREIMGCILVFTAVILAQIPGMKKGDTK